MFYTDLSNAVSLVNSGRYVFTGLTKSVSYSSSEKEYELSNEKERAKNVWLPEYEAMQLATVGYYVIKNDSNTHEGKMYEMAYNG